MAQWTRSCARIVGSRPAASSAWLTSMMSPCQRSTITYSISRRGNASDTHAASMSPEQWKVVYRAFLLQIHPDFFHGRPKERAVNEKSLKTFQQHLHFLDHGSTSSPSRGSGTHVNGNTRLVFFLKPGSSREDADSKRHEDGANIGPNSDNRSDNESTEATGNPLPRKVILPLDSHQSMAHLLHATGITPTPAPPPPPPLDGRSASRQRGSPSEATPGDWDDWMDDLFGGTAANRAWDEAAARKRRSSRKGYDDTSTEGRQRTTEWGAASEEDGQRGASRLGQVLATDAGRTLVRERRASARSVRRLVGELRETYGFGDFSFRCGWSKANLCVALGSLLETCDAHCEVFRVSNFGGLEVVFGNDPSVLRRGEIRLCPADVPLEWIEVLQGVTPKVLSSVEASAREVLSLQEQASAILRGASLSRGLSCSKTRYRQFLQGLCTAGADLGVGESVTDVSPNDWSILRCRVEEGFSHVSKVLEDGTIQIGSDMTLGTLQKCLGRDFQTSAAIATESARLTAAATATTTRCRQSLGLEAIERARSVTVSQMVTACESLIASLGDSESQRVEAEAVAARRRLRGHCVRVVGTRLGVFDGLTEDGEIAIPWNWAGEE